MELPIRRGYGPTTRLAWCLVAQLLAAGGGHAAPPPGPLYDGADGVSCAYYNVGAGIAWKQKHGDWADAAGNAYGGRPFARTQVPMRDQGADTTWDVTELVRGWVAHRYPNDGVLVMSSPSGQPGILDYYSREASDPALRPRIELSWADGGTEDLPALADAALDCSTVTPLGDKPILKLGAHSRVAMRFAQPKGSGTLRHAVLRLRRSGGQYGDADFSVFRLLPPQPPPPAPPAPPGLAGNATDLEGLRHNPDVLFAEGFESDDWLRDWSEYDHSSTTIVTDHDPRQKFVPLHGRALKVTVPQGSTMGVNMIYLFRRKLGYEPEEVYFRYYLRFADNWSPVADGGKMPGVAGTYGRAAWGDLGSHGSDGWSTRGAYMRMPSRDNPMFGYTRLGSYVYQPDTTDPYGEVWEWGGAGGLQLERNRWYCIEQFLHLNTPGRHDGELKVWVDGAPVFDHTGIRFRDTDALKVERLWLNVYHGGTIPALRDVSLYIDDIVVAKRYIGPWRAAR